MVDESKPDDDTLDAAHEQVATDAARVLGAYEMTTRDLRKLYPRLVTMIGVALPPADPAVEDDMAGMVAVVVEKKEPKVAIVIAAAMLTQALSNARDRGVSDEDIERLVDFARTRTKGQI